MNDNSNIVELNMITRLDIPASKLLKQALKDDLKSVVLMGWDKEDNFTFRSSLADGGDVLWLIELVKKRLME